MKKNFACFRGSKALYLYVLSLVIDQLSRGLLVNYHMLVWISCDGKCILVEKLANFKFVIVRKELHTKGGQTSQSWKFLLVFTEVQKN